MYRGCIAVIYGFIGVVILGYYLGFSNSETASPETLPWVHLNSSPPAGKCKNNGNLPKLMIIRVPYPKGPST